MPDFHPHVATPFGEVTYSESDGLENWHAILYLRAMGKPTMTAKSKNLKKSAIEYNQSFCPAILAGFNRAGKFQSALEIRLNVQFATTDESRWNQPHDQKPDMTNILKGIEDALLVDDSKVAWQHNAKFWGPEDRIVIHLLGVRRLGDAE